MLPCPIAARRPSDSRPRRPPRHVSTYRPRGIKCVRQVAPSSVVAADIALRTNRASSSSVNSLDMVIAGGYRLAGLTDDTRFRELQVFLPVKFHYRHLWAASSPSTLCWCKGGSGSKRDINSCDLNALVWGPWRLFFCLFSLYSRYYTI
jgi:hypothetical protein